MHGISFVFILSGYPWHILKFTSLRSAWISENLLNKRDSILEPRASEKDDLSTQPPDLGIPYLVYSVLGLLNFIEKYEMRPGGKKKLASQIILGGASN